MRQSAEPRTGLALALEARRDRLGFTQPEAVEEILSIAKRLGRKDLTLSIAGWRYWTTPRKLGEPAGIDEKWDPVIAEFLGVTIPSVNSIRFGLEDFNAEASALWMEERLASSGSPGADLAYAAVQDRDAIIRDAIAVLRGLKATPEDIARLEARLDEVEAAHQAQMDRLAASMKRHNAAVKRLTGLVNDLTSRRPRVRQATS